MSTAAVAADPESEAQKPQRILDIDPPEKPLPLPAMLKLVAEKHGKSLPQMVAEIARLSFGPGKVSTEEYFDLRLYDDEALAGQDKKTFLGMRGSKQIGLEANQNEHWFSVVSDKIVFYTLMAGYGFPTIRQKALYHPHLHMPAFSMQRKADDIVQFLKTTTDFPLFGKPCNSSLSLGTVSIDGRDEATGELILRGGRRVDARSARARNLRPLCRRLHVPGAAGSAPGHEDLDGRPHRHHPRLHDLRPQGPASLPRLLEGGGRIEPRRQLLAQRQHAGGRQHGERHGHARHPRHRPDAGGDHRSIPIPARRSSAPRCPAGRRRSSLPSRPRASCRMCR